MDEFAIVLHAENRFVPAASDVQPDDLSTGSFQYKIVRRRRRCRGKSMIATMTSKGQVTLPKEIRSRLGLETGAKLDFVFQEDGTVIIRPVTRTALGLSGMLRRPGQRPVSVKRMNEGIADHLAEKHGRKRR
jgi:antitoxin PrlF